MPFKTPTVKDVTEFLREVRERYAYALSLDAIDRAEAVEDVRFAAATPIPGGGSSQWSESAMAQRKSAKRPVLTENRLPTFINQVVNDGRQSKPAIRLTPLDGASKETAEMLQGRIRHIEYESDADTVYDTSRKQQVTCGRAFVRVTTKYKPGSREEQEPRLERIANQFSVVFGPAQEFDFSDAEYCFVITTISKAKHERDYGKNTVAQQNSFFSSTAECPAPDWFNVGRGGEQVQIAEYWLKTTAADGEVTVTQYILNGAEILDETEFLAPYIGIVPVWGDEQIVDGIRRTYSLIRQAKDPQRLINLYVSNIAEMIALAPRNPYRAPVGAIAGFEETWQAMNQEARAYIPYNQWDESGREVRAPEREVAEPPIQALVIGYNQAVDALKASMGMFDASLGAKSNETAGIAIERRQRESDNANFHFHDNEARSRKSIGRILLALILKLDAGEEKNVPVRSEDGKKTRMVRINTAQPYQDEETGEAVHHQIGTGEYAVSTGRSYSSAREEAFDTYSEIAKADPRFMALAGDILFRNLDAPGADEIADRYEKTLPPQLQPQKGQQQIPPQAQQAMAAMQQQLQQTEAFAKSLHEQIVTKQAELDNKKEIAAMQEDTKRTVALATLSAQDGLALLRADVERIEAMLDREHQQATQTSDQAHAQQTQASDQAQAAQAQASDQAHSSQTQAADQAHQASQAELAQQAAQQQAEQQNQAPPK